MAENFFTCLRFNNLEDKARTSDIASTVFQVTLQTILAFIHILYKQMFVKLETQEAKSHLCVVTC